MPKNVRSFTTLLFQIEATLRYLKGERQWVQVFEFGDMRSEVTVFSDSDLAGDKRNEEIVKRGSRARGTTPFESVHKKTEDHRQKE